MTLLAFDANLRGFRKNELVVCDHPERAIESQSSRSDLGCLGQVLLGRVRRDSDKLAGRKIDILNREAALECILRNLYRASMRILADILFVQLEAGNPHNGQVSPVTRLQSIVGSNEMGRDMTEVGRHACL